MKKERKPTVDEIVCEKSKCCGCCACESICPRQAITIKDEIQYMVPEIDGSRCVHCGLCYKVCPNHQKSDFLRPVKWYQGWAKEQDVREKSSSGGAAQAISRSFVENGGYVCSCLFQNGQFEFQVTNSVGDLKKFRGSKYVKSNPRSCYSDIVRVLKDFNAKLLFIGLPCQAAAVWNYVGDKYKEKLYTIDLICHGTPSVKVLKHFLEDHKLDIGKLKKIRFRQKARFAVKGETSFEPYGVMDEYSVAFLNGICYTENCYQCMFARTERASDLTLGDSWGSELSGEVGKGISLILCQTEKGSELLAQTNESIELRPVDLNNAIACNPQLHKPLKRPQNLDKFFSALKKGKTLKYAVAHYCFQKYARQMIKKLLIKMRVLKIEAGYAITYRIK